MRGARGRERAEREEREKNDNILNDFFICLCQI